MSRKIMSEVFKLGDTSCYNLRYTTLQFSTDPTHSTYNGIASAWYLGPKNWEKIPAEIQNKKFLDNFKRKIKKWKSVKCPCRICRTLLLNSVFI